MWQRAVGALNVERHEFGEYTDLFLLSELLAGFDPSKFVQCR
jgi:hypothetical protein